MNRIGAALTRTVTFRGANLAFGVIVLVLLVIAPDLSTGFGWNRQNLVQVLSSAGISGILVLSLNLAMGFGGMMSLGHTALLAVGGYGLGILAMHYDVDPWLGLLGSIAVTAIVAFVLTAATLRATDMYFGLITLSFSLLVVAVAQQWESMTGGFNGLILLKRLSLGGTPFTDEDLYYVIIGALVIAYLFQRNIVLSPMGRQFQAIKESPETAASLGFDPRRGRLLVFTLSGAMAGLAGALYVQQLNFISPDSGSLNTTLPLFIALFVGGIATLAGPLLGVIAITLVNELLLNEGQTAQLVLGIVLLVSMFVIPEGIVGTWRNSRPAIAALGAATARSRRGSMPTQREAAGSVDVASATAPERGTPVLEAEGLSKSFGGVSALSHASLCVRAGQIHGLIGPNGAGKSTLVNCVTGSFKPDKGVVSVRGENIKPSQYRSARHGMCRVFQVPHTLDHLSVLDNVMVGLDGNRPLRFVGSLFRLPRYRAEEQQFRQEAWLLLERFGLANDGYRPASVLSHGQRRLLEVVRAVARRPDILVLDEPATGLTRSELVELASLLRELRDGGMAILLIEHNMEFVVELCSEITVLAMGAVIATGTADEVMVNERVRSVYLGDVAASEERPAVADGTKVS